MLWVVIFDGSRKLKNKAVFSFVQLCICCYVVISNIMEFLLCISNDIPRFFCSGKYIHIFKLGVCQPQAVACLVS